MQNVLGAKGQRYKLSEVQIVVCAKCRMCKIWFEQNVVCEKMCMQNIGAAKSLRYKMLKLQNVISANYRQCKISYVQMS